MRGECEMAAGVDFYVRVAAGAYRPPLSWVRPEGPGGEDTRPQVEPQGEAQVEGREEEAGEPRPFDPDRLKRMVPEELRERQQWVVWRYEETKDGRRTKMPYQLHTQERWKASSIDSKTWGYFGSALAVCEREGYDGVGFMLSADDPYVGIDLDHCRDPQTGEIEDRARAIVEAIDS